MLFNSYTFLFIFLPVTIGGFAMASRLGRRAATAWLVLCSAIFYGWWDPRYVLLLAAGTLVNWAIGTRLAREPRAHLLTLGIAFNLGLLGWFKYAGLFSRTFTHATGIDVIVDVALPLGISFFIFQKIAYLVDCHRGRVKGYGLADFTLFVWFFPQLIAGPIVHHHEFVSQYATRRPGIEGRNVAIGLTIFVIGLFKKVVVAETMSRYATPLFDAAATGYTVTLIEAWTASVAYTLQLYFDFSGYSDMAIGLGRIFGVRFPVNFASPYKATSIIEFWRRWHITLSRFLRDYLYFPLGGSRRGPLRRHANLMVVMLLGGLWHGANWTFVAWGGLHGLYLAVNHLWRHLTGRLRLGRKTAMVAGLAGWVLTFLAVVVAWVFFRAADFDAALNVLGGMVGWGEGRMQVTVSYLPLFTLLEPLLGSPVLRDKPLPYFDGFGQLVAMAACFALAVAFPNTQQIMRRYRPTYEPVEAPTGFLARLTWRPSWKWATIIIAMATVAVIRAMQPMEFIYWQF